MTKPQLDFSKMTDEAKRKYKELVKEQNSKPLKYKDKDMVIFPDDEDYIDINNHGHNKK
jgi:hypothetical protein